MAEAILRKTEVTVWDIMDMDLDIILTRRIFLF